MSDLKKSTKKDRRVIFDGIFVSACLLALVCYWFKIFSPSFYKNLIILVAIVGIFPVLKSVIIALKNKKVTVDLLASIALIFTYIQGQWVSSAFINMMLGSARLFEGFTRNRTKNIIERLLKYRPEKVKIKIGEKIEEISLEDTKQGDLVVVESGDRIPIDGTVISGTANVDQSTLTGESEPVSKKTGDQVYSSTLNICGSLLVRAEKIGQDTTLAKIIELVDKVSREKTPTERIADKFSVWYIFLTIFGSILIFIISKNLNLVLSILLVTCADDIAVAIPLGFTISIARAARDGIIIKGVAVIEALKKVTIFVTDKTGTLTKGSAKVIDIIVVDKISLKEFYEIIASLQINSRHPSSLAIIKFLKEKNVKIFSPDQFHEIPGDGIWIIKNKIKYIAGKISFLEENGIKLTNQQKEKTIELKNKGYSLTVISKEKNLIGLVILEDEMRQFVKESIIETREMGIKKWVMLTGDNEVVASKVSKEAGIDEYYANLKPVDKLTIIKKLKNKYESIAMIGDGVNDAASLALADVSIAMGAIGSDAAVETADVALMHDNFRRIPEAMLLSREVVRVIKQNFIIWGITNVVGLALVFGGIIGPLGASAYNFITDFFPIVNVFKIYRLKTNRHIYEEESKI